MKKIGIKFRDTFKKKLNGWMGIVEKLVYLTWSFFLFFFFNFNSFNDWRLEEWSFEGKEEKEGHKNWLSTGSSIIKLNWTSCHCHGVVHGSTKIQRASKRAVEKSIWIWQNSRRTRSITGKTSSIPMTSSPSGNFYWRDEIDVRYFNVFERERENYNRCL